MPNKSRRNKKQRNQLAPIPVGGNQRAPRKYGDFALYNVADPFPPRARCKLLFELQGNIASSATPLLFGAIGPVVFLNGCFSPTLPVSHQPYGWDQLTPLYGRYKPSHCRGSITVNFPSGTAGNIWLGVQMNSSNSSTTLAGATVASQGEQPMTVIRHLNGVSPSARITFDIPIAVIEGITASQYANDINLYQALVSANPAILPFLTFAIAAGGSATGTFTLKLEYTVDFWERLVQAQS